LLRESPGEREAEHPPADYRVMFLVRAHRVSSHGGANSRT
jgi:hypothetical protein